MPVAAASLDGRRCKATSGDRRSPTPFVAGELRAARVGDARVRSDVRRSGKRRSGSGLDCGTVSCLPDPWFLDLLDHYASDRTVSASTAAVAVIASVTATWLHRVGGRAA